MESMFSPIVFSPIEVDSNSKTLTVGNYFSLASFQEDCCGTKSKSEKMKCGYLKVDSSKKAGYCTECLERLGRIFKYNKDRQVKVTAGEFNSIQLLDKGY